MGQQADAPARRGPRAVALHALALACLSLLVVSRLTASVFDQSAAASRRAGPSVLSLAVALQEEEETPTSASSDPAGAVAGPVARRSSSSSSGGSDDVAGPVVEPPPLDAAAAAAAAADEAAEDGFLRPERAAQRCAIYNNVSHHFDVAAGLAWALQEAGCEMTAYLHHHTQGIEDVMSEWYLGEVRRLRPGQTFIRDEAPLYDLLVFITLVDPSTRFAWGQRELLLGAWAPPPHQRVALVVHNPTELLSARPPYLPSLLLVRGMTLEPAGDAAVATAAASGSGSGSARQQQQQQQQQQQPTGGGRQQQRRLAAAAPAKPAARPPRLQLLALSPNVAAFTTALLETWAAARMGPKWRPHVSVPWLPPLVPWQPSSAGSSKKRSSGNGSAEADAAEERPIKHLCMQGAIDRHRRNYDAAFAAAAHPAVLAALRARREALLLVGHPTPEGLPPVPKALQPFVRVVPDLAFKAYYETLASCRAILTAFESDVYLLNKTSSTIAASLHLGVPLLTDERTLSAYPFLRPEAAFTYRSGLPAPDPAAAGRAAVGELNHALLIRALDAGGGPRAARHLHAQGQPAAQQQQQQQQQPQQQRRRRQQETAADEGAPPPGSYAAAMLAAFSDDAVRSARAAARAVKQELMRHNVAAARQLLDEVAADAAAAARGNDSAGKG